MGCLKFKNCKLLGQQTVFHKFSYRITDGAMLKKCLDSEFDLFRY